MNNNQTIRELIDVAMEILQRIKIDYNSPLPLLFLHKRHPFRVAFFCWG